MRYDLIFNGILQHTELIHLLSSDKFRGDDDIHTWNTVIRCIDDIIRISDRCNRDDLGFEPFGHQADEKIGIITSESGDDDIRIMRIDSILYRLWIGPILV